MKNEIVKVNNVDIDCPFEKEQHYVALKPICQALGIDHSGQIKKLKLDGILGSTVVDICTTVGADKKQRECNYCRIIFAFVIFIFVSLWHHFPK